MIRVQGLAFGVWGLGSLSRVKGVGCRVLVEVGSQGIIVNTLKV